MKPKNVRDRFVAIQQIGCIACLQNGIEGVPCDIHHIISGGRRLGDMHTIGLCPHHHRGIYHNATTREPSLAKTPRRFREKFGSDLRLLEIQNDLLRLAELQVIARRPVG